MEFEWTPDKATLNIEKHGVSFQEAATVFNDRKHPGYKPPDSSVVK